MTSKEQFCNFTVEEFRETLEQSGNLNSLTNEAITDLYFYLRDLYENAEDEFKFDKPFFKSIAEDTVEYETEAEFLKDTRGNFKSFDEWIDFHSYDGMAFKTESGHIVKIG